MYTKTKLKGFTLIELIIAIAIIGVLAALAIPAYQESTAKTRRSDAQGALLGLTSALERFYTENNSYLEAADSGADTGAPAATLYPSQAPIDGNSKYYNLTIQAATGTTYTLAATPIVGTVMDGDSCGTFTITSAGVKGAGQTTCWK